MFPFVVASWWFVFATMRNMCDLWKLFFFPFWLRSVLRSVRCTAGDSGYTAYVMSSKLGTQVVFGENNQFQVYIFVFRLVTFQLYNFSGCSALCVSIWCHLGIPCWGPWGARRATAFVMSRNSVAFFWSGRLVYLDEFDIPMYHHELVNIINYCWFSSILDIIMYRCFFFFGIRLYSDVHQFSVHARYIVAPD